MSVWPELNSTDRLLPSTVTVALFQLRPNGGCGIRTNQYLLPGSALAKAW